MAPEFAFDHFVLKVRERQLLSHGCPVALGTRAFDVLCTLVHRAGMLVTKSELFRQVWPGMVVEENNLQVHVSALRKLVGADRIVTIPGQGYRFVARVARPPEPGQEAPRPLMRRCTMRPRAGRSRCCPSVRAPMPPSATSPMAWRRTSSSGCPGRAG
ncbi:winged helix-turn-helix domain-containing protein [Paracidovorax avenae]|uniref:winged helix-turn-helix domain-containing protein n=1 Tax=Paracidovorax avenae TaxID=80867 RepID=UPI001CEF95DD|nr:transcriptional regulator [Paracidovorax avenae]